jgi:bifunctional non-homologous end joining protein LigD
MRKAKAYEFALPVLGTKVPADEGWIHEVKHDGYRLRVERDGTKVRLISKGGHDFTDRYPWIAEAALQNRTSRFVLDGEAVVLRPDGISDFDAIQSRRRDNDVQLYAFDVMAVDGEDVRQLPLSMRKAHLDRLLRGRTEGVFVATFEQGESGPALFPLAIDMGLEGFVSKRVDRTYRAGRCDHWIKVKNQQHSSIGRVKRAFAAKA